MISHLAGGLEHDFYFPIQLGIIIPIDELLFFRGAGLTTNQTSPSPRHLHVPGDFLELSAEVGLSLAVPQLGVEGVEAILKLRAASVSQVKMASISIALYMI